MLDWLIATRLQARRLGALCFVVVLVSLATSPWIPIMLRQRDLMRSVYATQNAALSDPASIASAHLSLNNRRMRRSRAPSAALRSSLAFFRRNF